MAGPIEHNFVGASALLLGDTVQFTVTGLSFLGGRTLQDGVVRSTVKRYYDDPDPGLIQVDSEAGGVIYLSASSLRVIYPAFLVDALPAGRLHYDVWLDFDWDHCNPLQFGDIEFRRDITRST